MQDIGSFHLHLFLFASIELHLRFSVDRYSSTCNTIVSQSDIALKHILLGWKHQVVWFVPITSLILIDSDTLGADRERCVM
jgi:hypothetical protein